MSLDIKLQPIIGKATFSKQYKAKANSDGEDLVTRIVEMAAAEIAASID
jgi:hypothetical protein